MTRRTRIALLVSAVGFAAAACGNASHPPTTRTAATSSVTAPASAPTGESAEQAALRLATLAGALVPMPIEEAEAQQRSVATAAGADVLVARLRAGLADLDTVADRATMTYWVAPLAVRVVRLTGDAARVDVWYVGALSIGEARSAQEWRTVSYELSWQQGRWLEAAERSVEGPVPQPLPGAASVDPVEMATRLSGFHPVAAS